MPESKELAEAHWEYIKNMLLIHRIEKEAIEVIGYHYKTAFIHGYKHGVEDTIFLPEK